MKLTSQKIGNTNLLLVINLVAFVLLLNVLLFLLQSDVAGLHNSLSALQSDVSPESTSAVLTTKDADASVFEGLCFFTTAVMLPLQPATFFSYLLFW